MSTPGSMISKNGFLNEQVVADKLNNWQYDVDAQSWLGSMNYNVNNIVSVEATRVGQLRGKSDVHVVICINEDGNF